MLVFHHQNAGQNQDIQIANKTSERVTVEMFVNDSNKSKLDGGGTQEKNECW
jgi:hypothetical protein